ncbi:MAG TPA: protein kinase [Kofleriaceae bacterium]|nr:protein kinase [Kofleriaceae bacterium]
MELAPGTILLGKYRIDALIGSGGMGNVVRASHLYLHQSFAIKILLPQMVESDSTKQRFLREAQATVKLKGEHCARVMDVGVTPDGAPFMVMEFLDGNDLNQILRHHGPQIPGIVVDLMLQACEGIAEAHALGIVHRDIKPSNFFITRRPDGSMLLKILDFGISKAQLGLDELTATQTVIGTPSYMAPEQMKSGRAADPRSDIWSIGVVMYQLLTGRTPFMGESYAELVLKVGLEPPLPILVPLPPGLAEVVLRCLEKDPAARYQDVGELARMLAPYASDPIGASQSAGRAMRILQQRGAPPSLQGTPLAAGGGIPSPTPISPMQLTPRSWPGNARMGPSHTSLSQGAGQVTYRTRGGRGLLIAGVAALCILAGVGGYAISQATKPDHGRNEPHVDAPAMRPAAPPGEAKPTEATTTKPHENKPPEAKATEATAKPDENKPPEAKAIEATAKPDESKPSEAKPTEATTKPDESKPPEAKPTEAKPTEAKPTEAKDTKSGAKPADAKSKPKPKKSDDLFDTRH